MKRHADAWRAVASVAPVAGMRGKATPGGHRQPWRRAWAGLALPVQWVLGSLWWLLNSKACKPIHLSRPSNTHVSVLLKDRLDTSEAQLSYLLK